MATARSNPIGPALLQQRPFAYLPGAVRRFLRPASLGLGKVVATRGFVEQVCEKDDKKCFTLSPPANRDPSYFQEGINDFSFAGRFRMAGGVVLDLQFGVSVKTVGHLIRGKRVYRQHTYGGCPETCKSDSITGVFAAVIETELTLGADLPEIWNRRVALDSLSYLILPFGLGWKAGETILKNYSVGKDGKLKSRNLLNLGPFVLSAP